MSEAQMNVPAAVATAPVEATPKPVEAPVAPRVEAPPPPLTPEQEAFQIGHVSILHAAEPAVAKAKKGEKFKTQQEKSIHFYADLSAKASGIDGRFNPPISTAGGEGLGKPIYVVKGSDGRWQPAFAETPNAVALNYVTGKKTGGDGANILTGIIAGGAPIDLPAQTVLDAQLISEGDLIISQVPEAAQKLLRTRLEVLKKGSGTVDIALVKEAARSQVLTTESLTTFVNKKAPVETAPPDATPEQIALIEGRRERRQAIIDRLSNHTIASAQDFAEVMSFCAPQDIQTSLAQMGQERAALIQELSVSRGTDREAGIIEQLNKLDEQKKNLVESLKIFDDPQQLQQFFDFVGEGKITSAHVAQINQFLQDGNLTGSLDEILKGKLDAMAPEERTKMQKLLEGAKAMGKYGAIAVAAVMVLMVMRGAGGQ